MNHLSSHHSKGFIILSSVLIIAVVLVGVVLSSVLVAANEGQSSLALYQGERAFYLSEGCMEEALNNTRLSADYSGGTVTMPDGSCAVTVSQTGDTWTLVAASTFQNFTRNIETVITKNVNGIDLVSWREL